MVLVVSHTQPAELVPALRAGHVHATLILLDLSLTLRAWLSVKLEPDIIVILTLVNASKPFDKIVTWQRSVSLLEALEAPVIPTICADDVGLLHRLILIGEATAGAWTPFRPPVNVNEGLLVIVLKLLVLILCQCFLKERLRHNQFAWCLGTNCVYTVRPEVELADQIT